MNKAKIMRTVALIVLLVICAGWAYDAYKNTSVGSIGDWAKHLFDRPISDPFPNHITLTTNWSAVIYTPDSRSFDWQVRGRVEKFYVRDQMHPERVFTVNFGQVLDTGGVRLQQWQFRLDKPAEDIVLAYRLQ